MSDEDVRAHLSPKDAYVAMRQCFIDLATGDAMDEPRHRMPLGQGSFNVMWSSSDSLDTVALKAYPVIRGDVRQATAIHLFLFAKSTGELHTTMRGDVLGQLRTGAASAVAAELLAGEGPRSVAIFGTGLQAHGQVQALLHRFPSLHRVHVVSRTPSAAKVFASQVSTEFGGRDVEIVAAGAEAAVTASTLVVTATASREPLFDGEWLQPGTHVAAVGSNHPGAREIDARTVSRSAVVAVDSRAAAHQESGDLIINGYDPGQAVELGELLTASTVPVRTPGDITLFTSHGLAVQDLYAASAVLANRRRHPTAESEEVQSVP